MKFRPFEELFEIPLRNGLTKPKRVRGEGYKMINMGELFKVPRMKNIVMDRVPLNEKEYASSMVEAGDLLFARQSLVLEGAGQCSIFIEDEEEVCFESHLIRCRLNPEIANPLFYYYFFSSRLGKQAIYAIVEQGAGAAGIRGSDLAKVLVPDIDIKVQNKIAEIVDQVDNKIELNRQTNQTLEHMAQAIFKSWFVDFEPTRAKIAAKEEWAKRSMTTKAGGSDNNIKESQAEATFVERAAMAAISGRAIDSTNDSATGALAGLDQLNSEQILQLKTTAALFPDALVDSELGEIPEGWREGCVGDIAIAKGGYAFKGKSFVEKGHPVVKIKNITGDGRVDLSGAVCIDDEQAKSSERFKLKDGNLLMAMTGATVGKIGFVVTEGKSVYLNQRVAKFESEKFGEKAAWFLFCCFERDSIFDLVVGAAQGSAQPNISSTGIESTKIVLPSDDLVNLFCNKTDSLFRKWLAAINENSYLEDQRDTLLPKLLAGELMVS